MRRLAGSRWGANRAFFQIAVLAFVYSITEHCAAVWCHNVHTCIIDTAINNAFRIVTGCLRPTPVHNLPILAGIQPAELHRRQPILSLSCWALVQGHMLCHKLADPAKQPRQLTSQYPICACCNTFPHKYHGAKHQYGMVGRSRLV